MSRNPQASRCTTKSHNATLASVTSDARNWPSSAADASREWSASNWANAASVVSSARPSRPSADAFSRPNSSASTSAGECFILRWGIAPSAGVGTPSSIGDHRPVEPNSGKGRLMHLRVSAHIVAAAAAACARRGHGRNNNDEGNLHHNACCARDHCRHGPRRLVAREPEGRDPAARRVGRRRRRARPARRHFQEARARSRNPLRPGRPGIDPGGDRRQHGYRDRRGVSAAVGTFAKGAPIRIIGSEMIGAPDLYWYVPANSPIRKVEDFNGRTVAFSLTGSSSHATLLALIAQYKLTAKPTSTGNIAATITQ